MSDETHHWKLKVCEVTFRPTGFEAAMELQATYIETKKIEEYSDKKELFAYPIPDLGFEIKDLCTVGAVVKYQIGYYTKLLGTATFVVGADSKIPDDAVVTIDLLHEDKVSVSGFDGPLWQPVFDIKELTASLKFAVFTQADLAFEIELHHIGKWAVELNLKIPQLSATANAGYSKHFSSPFLKSMLIPNLFLLIGKAGFCKQERGALQTGAKFTVAMSLELWFEVYLGDEKHNAFSHKFFGLSHTFVEDCSPINITNLLPIPPEWTTSDLPDPGSADGGLAPPGPQSPRVPDGSVRALLGPGKFKAGAFQPPGP